MPINVLPKETPRGRGPDPTQAANTKADASAEGEKALQEKESELADLETQALWESQEVGNTSWSGADGTRYSDPN